LAAGARRSLLVTGLGMAGRYKTVLDTGVAGVGSCIGCCNLGLRDLGCRIGFEEGRCAADREDLGEGREVEGLETGRMSLAVGSLSFVGCMRVAGGREGNSVLSTEIEVG